jgi:hypothetical protein
MEFEFYNLYRRCERYLVLIYSWIHNYFSINFKCTSFHTSDKVTKGDRECNQASFGATSVQSIEIIDIECVLLSFLSKKIVSTKRRIYKGILVGPRFLRQVISRGFKECELLFFSTAKFAVCKKYYIRTQNGKKVL